MTLLELLVKELPKRGGWPELAKETIEMHDDGEIFFDGDLADNFCIPQCSDGWRHGSSKYSYSTNGRSWSNEVTREQYESALAASKQPIVIAVFHSNDGSSDSFCAITVEETSDSWRGNKVGGGGYHCYKKFWRVHFLSEQQPAWEGDGLPPVGSNLEYHARDGSIFKVKVVGSDGDKAILKTDLDNYFACKSDQLKPIRTEADRKREEVGKALYEAIWAEDMQDYNRAYDAIAEGKIPGVKLDN